MKDRLSKIRQNALNQIEEAGALEKLNDIRVAFLGKKGRTDFDYEVHERACTGGTSGFWTDGE